MSDWFDIILTRDRAADWRDSVSEELAGQVVELDLQFCLCRPASPAKLKHVAETQFWRRKWQAIARAYNVTQILTRVDYTLDLPVAAQSRAFRLYRIPD